jgi:hypothetical protein
MKTLHLTGFCLLLALAACGGGSGNTAATPPVVAPPVVTLDAFFKAVQGAIGMAPDDREPVDIGAVAVTARDDTEPEKVD